ncbi:5-oxoprolinase [Trichomonascus vanleenenianus]|uniref:5-oxoprolinase n=1 Tax=Trichomonascus vanleenenianus TaxID=2268995 RepID=UPI003ECAB724
MKGIRISIDRGGTFTDVCAHTDDGDHVLKLLSVDPANYDDAPTEGIRRILNQLTGSDIKKGDPIDLAPVESIRMGTTVATNALLERKGDRVAFLVTKGFKDILTIGQQARPSIFDLTVDKLGHLHEQVHEIDERVTVEGYSENPFPETFDEEEVKASSELTYGISGEVIRILKTPDVAAVRKIVQGIWDSGIRSLAIALMHSYIYPEHEEIVAKEARAVGFKDVSVSNEIQPMIKLVSRANSSSADAYLSPITTRYIQQFGRGFKGGLEEMGHKLLFMQSDGGLTSWSKFSGLRAILSGPAGGVVGYARTSYEEEDRHPVLGFDMGGTSTDVSRYSGALEHIFETTTAQVTIQAPQLDINTVAAGGGSILFWKKGLFVVGPESASAHPGPACYRKGGPLTVTDANLFLGRILPEFFPKIFGPNEDEPLDVDIVEKKFTELTKKINADRKEAKSDSVGLTPQEVAMGFLTVANEAMCRPIRTLTEGKGYAASAHHLASFGGAGGQHACDIAANLGIDRVIIHRYSSLLSAYGMTLADVVHEVQRPESTVLDQESLVGLNKRLDEISAEACEGLAAQGFTDRNYVTIERYLNLRYRGTETFIMVKYDETKSYEASFIEQHAQEFGFSLEREILVGDIRVRGIGRSKLNVSQSPGRDLAKVAGHSTTPTPLKKTKVYFKGSEWIEAGIYTIDGLKPGDRVKGPAMIIDKTQTIVVAPNAIAISLPQHIVIDMTEEVGSGALSTKVIDPIQLSVFGHRFMSIAEQMGQTLQKTSISTNIKERLDFSCAIFSPDGGLVANAPHIPVHLGSMSSAVAYQKEMWKGKLNAGDVLVANHPAYGGSHLPDITVITPVFSLDGKEIIFWAASRGHHSDIGGITAGSMPPFSKEIWEEGAMIKGFKVVEEGRFNEQGIIDLLYNEPSKYPGCGGSRSLSDSISDLKAQIAANNKGINLLKSLIEEHSLEVVQLYMYGIQDNAESSVRELLKGVCERFGENGRCELYAKDQIDDGTEIKLRIIIDGATGGAVFDFAGTGKQVYGNLNAPRAITRSAILYVLRSMISDDIPLNQGCLAPIDIRIPEGSLLAPSADAATVGGNVETSQRVTDVVLKAFRYMGASQGTCNNLTFGYGGDVMKNGKLRPGFGYYETIAGGAGAGPSWNGQSGVQVHMTNTRSTDPEILEKRYPCILHQFGLREGSGGAGKFVGGNGVVRDIEFRVPVQLSILSERRTTSPYGMEGGHKGAKGENLWIRASDGREVSLGGKNTVQVNAGDRIIIQTPGGGGYGAPERA